MWAGCLSGFGEVFVNEVHNRCIILKNVTSPLYKWES